MIYELFSYYQCSAGMYCCIWLPVVFTGSGDDRGDNDGEDNAESDNTVVVVVIIFAVTFIVSVTATAIITFIVAYVCVKRRVISATSHHKRRYCMSKWDHPTTLLLTKIWRCKRIQPMIQVMEWSWILILHMRAVNNELIWKWLHLYLWTYYLIQLAIH